MKYSVDQAPVPRKGWHPADCSAHLNLGNNWEEWQFNVVGLLNALEVSEGEMEFVIRDAGFLFLLNDSGTVRLSIFWNKLMESIPPKKLKM
jgi:hypothetical protein